MRHKSNRTENLAVLTCDLFGLMVHWVQEQTRACAGITIRNVFDQFSLTHSLQQMDLLHRPYAEVSRIQYQIRNSQFDIYQHMHTVLDKS